MIDASIPLQVRPPQIETPDQVEASALQLQGMRQQQQLGQLNAQALTMENQQRQLDLQDQQTLKQAWMDAGGDMSRALTLAQQRGISPKNWMAVNQGLIAQREALAKLSGEQLENIQKQHDMARGLLQPVLDAPPEQQAALWTQQYQKGVAQGLIDPHDQTISQTFPGADQAKQIALGLATGSQLAKEATEQKQADARMLTASTGVQKEQREAGRQDFMDAISGLATNMPKSGDDYVQRLQSVPYGVARRILAQLPPEQFNPQTFTQQIRQIGMSPDQQQTAEQAAANAAETARNHRVEEQQGAARIGIEAQAQALRQRQFDATIGQGLDANGQIIIGGDGKPVVSPAAQMVADYQIGGPRVSQALLRSPGMLAQVKAANPAWDAKNYEAAQNIRVQKGGNIQALNTAIAHMDQLGAAATAMGNGSFQPGNATYNWLRTTFGGAAPTNFEGLKNAVAGEMANALKGNATDPEIANISKTIGAASSPQQLAGIVKENLNILAAKTNTYDEQYHQAVGANDPWHPLLPTASSVLQKWGVNQKPQVSGPANQQQQFTVGQQITLRNGKTVTVTAVHPDGSWDAK